MEHRDSTGCCACFSPPMDVAKYFPLPAHIEKQREDTTSKYLKELKSWREKPENKAMLKSDGRVNAATQPNASLLAQPKPVTAVTGTLISGGPQKRGTEEAGLDDITQTGHDLTQLNYPTRPWDAISEEELSALELGLSFVAEILRWDDSGNKSRTRSTLRNDLRSDGERLEQWRSTWIQDREAHIEGKDDSKASSEVGLSGSFYQDNNDSTKLFMIFLSIFFSS